MADSFSFLLSKIVVLMVLMLVSVQVSGMSSHLIIIIIMIIIMIIVLKGAIQDFCNLLTSPQTVPRGTGIAQLLS